VDYNSIQRVTEPNNAIAYHNYVYGRKSIFDYVESLAKFATELERPQDEFMDSYM